MRVKSFVALATFIVSITASLVPAPRSSTPRVVSLGLERKQVKDVLAYRRNRLRRRANTVTEALDNEETLYFANLTIGTPAQSLRLHIDTGSSDLWVNTKNSTLCSRTGDCVGGTYDSSSSSTMKIVNNDFNISYVDGSSASGDYVTDTLTFGGVTLDSFQFGLGESSASYEGVLGIGYKSNEVQVQRAGLTAYPNLPQALVNGGYIARNAYSLWLNDLSANTGQLTYGGVDVSKFSGSLATIPILKTDGGYYQLSIALTAVTLNSTDISSDALPLSALLDSGTTLTYLPEDICASIFDAVDAVYDSSEGVAYADCDLATSGTTVGFTFSGKTITVSLDELLLEVYDSNGSPLVFPETKKQACMFGIAPIDSSGTYVLGDTFLRSAYVVYDLENNQISLGQTIFNTTASDVQEIPSGTSLPPGATAVASAVTTVASGSGTSLGSVATGSVTSASGASSGTQPYEGLLFLAVLAGIYLLAF